jgi:hypothetical protein
MLYGAADFYTFVTKLHNVSSVLNYATWIKINHSSIGELESGGINQWNIKLSSRWVEMDSFISQLPFPL